MKNCNFEEFTKQFIGVQKDNIETSTYLFFLILFKFLCWNIFMYMYYNVSIM